MCTKNILLVGIFVISDLDARLLYKTKHEPKESANFAMNNWPDNRKNWICNKKK